MGCDAERCQEKKKEKKFKEKIEIPCKPCLANNNARGLTLVLGHKEDIYL